MRVSLDTVSITTEEREALAYVRTESVPQAQEYPEAHADVKRTLDNLIQSKLRVLLREYRDAVRLHTLKKAREELEAKTQKAMALEKELGTEVASEATA